MSNGSQAGTVVRLLSAFLLLALLSGCATSRIGAAREHFYRGRFDKALTDLGEIPSGSTDRVLYLMERGMIRQAQGDYEESIDDWLAADRIAKELDFLSVSRSSASFVVNDRLLAFRGVPYERTLLHTFAAKSYLALGMWDDAAVEARNIVYWLENRGDFPDDPYSRYLAALTFELIGDSEGAAFQYRVASNIVSDVEIDAGTGAIGKPAGDGRQDGKPATELVCFILIARSPSEYGAAPGNYRWGHSPYAEIRDSGGYRGRSYTLSNTHSLTVATDKILIARQALKTATRIAMKEAAAQALSHENEALGDLLRLILFSMETPDTRHWEALPLWLQVARVPCSPDLKSFDMVFKGASGGTVEQRTITTPLTRRGNLFISFCRVF